ncbi:hypothetical protein RFI_13229 [Reticulomyxa filosa]|uniref:Protein kinase domain-containing protein n=1 Tax=Reticulomyxa filosa TaxID=46433 RepID=X6NCA7_RETFI|nr:hypothetical protein RFI_13229 [Reticulomyxa filosa]|eukprot:ETO23930.1 hypothetical protein RFI_13229 [Reticulomyxa filosa]
MFQLFRACGYLSRRQICHRDIKPQNIMVNPVTHDIRLCDFGSAKILSDRECNKHYICSRFYRAPELLCEAEHYTCSVDSWSIGCVMAEMYLGEPLFAGMSTQHQLKLIGQVLGPTPFQYPHSFIQSTIVTTNGWRKVLRHRYKNPTDEGADLLRQILQYSPNSRIDVMKALFHPFLREVGIGLSAPDNNGDNKNIQNDQSSHKLIPTHINNIDAEQRKYSPILPNIKWAPSTSYSDKDITAIQKTFKGFKMLEFLEEEVPCLQKMSENFI